jgi:hypothetical protein
MVVPFSSTSVVEMTREEQVRELRERLAQQWRDHYNSDGYKEHCRRASAHITRKPGYLGRQRIVKIFRARYTPEQDRERDLNRLTIMDHKDKRPAQVTTTAKVVYMPKPFRVSPSKKGCQEKVVVLPEVVWEKRMLDRRHDLEMLELRERRLEENKMAENDSHRRFPQTPKGVLLRMSRLSHCLKMARKISGRKRRRSKIKAVKDAMEDLSGSLFSMSLESTDLEEKEEINPFSW